MLLWGTWVAQAVKRLPSARVVISDHGIETRIETRVGLRAQRGVCGSLPLRLPVRTPARSVTGK